MPKILILGASSWIGHELVSGLLQEIGASQIIGTTRNKNLILPIQLEYFDIKDSKNLHTILANHKPQLVFNLCRIENNLALSAHKIIIDYCEHTCAHYSYFSSANACDALPEFPKNEEQAGQATSEYGKFKAKCEILLIQSKASFTAFRFAGCHGYAPNRLSRTEIFLAALKNDEVINIPTGVVQNRMFSTDLGHAAAICGLESVQGICHLGTIDSSRENDFFEKMALAFGYSVHKIMPFQTEEFSITMTPKKILSLRGGAFVRTEKQTIQALVNHPKFSIYHNLK